MDLLPWKKSPGRQPGKLGNLRYLHFFASFLLMSILFFALRISSHDLGGFVFVNMDVPPGFKAYSNIFQIPEYWWFISGNALYYLSGILLAAYFKDNRAFCKYLCPIATFLKVGSRFSLVKIRQVADGCNLCMACEKNCPMDIKITEYTQHAQRVGSTECIICQTCISSCPKKVLGLSLGFDMGRAEHLRSVKSEIASVKGQVARKNA